MRKFFILTLMVASLLMVSCVERRNRVIIDKFIPITEDSDCMAKVGGDVHYTEGSIDLAFTFDYYLAFQITNYIPSSDGGSDSSLTTAEANYFYCDEVEIEYDWWPKAQYPSGAQLSLDQNLWNKNKRKMDSAVVIPPNGQQAAAAVHIFNEAQANDLLDHVNDIDWIANPLIIKIRAVGKLADGTEVKTNQMKFNIIPNFGESIQMGSTYPYPDGGFQAQTGSDGKEVCAEKVHYNVIKDYCAFEAARLNGCAAGQDTTLANCYAGDTPWERYITEKFGGTYTPGFAAMGVVEMIYNTYKKSSDDTNYYMCCPGELPEEPECPEEEDDSSSGN